MAADRTHVEEGTRGRHGVPRAYIPTTERRSARDARRAIGVERRRALRRYSRQRFVAGALDVPPALTETDPARAAPLADKNLGRRSPQLPRGAAPTATSPGVVGKLRPRRVLRPRTRRTSPRSARGRCRPSSSSRRWSASSPAWRSPTRRSTTARTAAAEAVLMALRLTGAAAGRSRAGVTPSYRRGAARPMLGRGIEVEIGRARRGRRADDDPALGRGPGRAAACVVVQSRTSSARSSDWPRLAERRTRPAPLFVVGATRSRSALLEAAGRAGRRHRGRRGPAARHAAAGSAGPASGLFAAREEVPPPDARPHRRADADREGRRGFVLTLQTREQHIRRETGDEQHLHQPGAAGAARDHLPARWGRPGLREVAELSHAQARQLRRAAARGGRRLATRRSARRSSTSSPSALPVRPRPRGAGKRGILGGLDLGRAGPGPRDTLLLAVTELTNTRTSSASCALGTRWPWRHAPRPLPSAARRVRPATRAARSARRAIRHVRGLAGPRRRAPARGACAVVRRADAARRAPARRRRAARGQRDRRHPPLHACLSQNHAIDLGIYPLGSCTMKYNPKINEAAARLPGFANIHPYQDPETVQGALELMWELQEMLARSPASPRSRCSRRPARRAS